MSDLAIDVDAQNQQDVKEVEPILLNNNHDPISTKDRVMYCLPILFIVCIIVAAIIVVAVLPVTDYLENLVDFLDSLGAGSYFLILAIYVLIALTGIPRWLISIAVGFIYGVLVGLFLELGGLLIGTSVIYIIANWFVTPEYREKLRSSFPSFHGLELAAKQHGVKTVFFFNLSPAVPYTLGAYILSIMDIPFPLFLSVTVASNLLYSVSYVVTGAGATRITDAVSGDGTEAWETALFVGGWVLTIIFTVWLCRASKRHAASLQLEMAELEQGNTGV